MRYLDLRSSSSKHLVPFCFGKCAHRCTEQEREEHYKNDLQSGVSRNNKQDSGGSDQKADSRESKDESHNDISTVFTDQLDIFIICFKTLFRRP